MSHSVPWRGTVARVAVVLLLVTFLVPAGRVEVWATPVTLAETIDGLPELPSPAEGSRGGPALAGAGEDAHDTDTSRSDLVEAPLTFSAIGATVPPGATEIRVRTSTDGTTFGPWDELELLEPDDGPDPGTEEARGEAPGLHAEPLWVGEATHLQLEVDGASVEDVEVVVIDSMGHSGGPVQWHREPVGPDAAEASGIEDLTVISRAQWGADESLGSSRVSVADEVHMGVVHHTAHASTDRANNYTRDEVPGIIRAMHRYHTQTLGWSDIGYNVLVDRFGRVYEGRKGGFERGVIGAHARGFNTGSFGVSVIGNFVDVQAPTAAIESLTKVIGLKSAIHGIDPTGTTTKMGSGERRPTIVGHRDVGNTACPGRIRDLLPQIRSAAAELAIRFPDVSTTSPHRPAILALADEGVTRGCLPNAYCPSKGLNRAQASTFVVQALELEPIPGSRFPDVPEDATHAATINVLAEHEWLVGYSDGRFGPWDQMTRGQLATLLVRSLGLPLATPASDPYPDVSRHSTHAPAIAMLKNHGISGNCGGGRFCPDDVVLRDSTASFVHAVRELHKQQQEAG